ncbi:hypothetical protein, partial [Pseudoxanthomonas kalamensis]|uniref:hypothetical protein n=1 Tax=Pseudoxanthomonas kalamensis TaxID=289483 RepID=UPI001390BEBC
MLWAAAPAAGETDSKGGYSTSAEPVGRLWLTGISVTRGPNVMVAAPVRAATRLRHIVQAAGAALGIDVLDPVDPAAVVPPSLGAQHLAAGAPLAATDRVG